jgi:hypothetical protein
LTVLVQVPYLYLSPMCLLACLTMARPVKMLKAFESVVLDLSPEAVTAGSSGGGFAADHAHGGGPDPAPPVGRAAACMKR